MYSIYKQGGKINIELIDTCSESEWEEREHTLIQKYKDMGYELLNIDKGGKGVITAEKRSSDSITRSAEAHKKPITAFNLDGTKFKDFDSLTNAAKFLNGKINNIESALKGFSKSACGYMWKYKTNEECIDKYEKESTGTKIYQFNLNGTLIQSFNSKKEVLNFLKTKSHHPLNRAIKNKTEYKKFFWALTSQINKNEFISPFKYRIFKGDEIIKVIEQKEISEIVGISKSTVCTKLKTSTNFYYNGYFVELI